MTTFKISVFIGNCLHKKVFLFFKMSIYIVSNRVDLVKLMQNGHNLENAWVTCLITSSAHQRLDNHGVSHVCMTPIYLKMLTIIISNMQLEDTNVQCVLWKKFNEVMLIKTWKYSPHLKGFMMDNA
jgi:hypothetical protein